MARTRAQSMFIPLTLAVVLLGAGVFACSAPLRECGVCVGGTRTRTYEALGSPVVAHVTYPCNYCGGDGRIPVIDMRKLKKREF